MARPKALNIVIRPKGNGWEARPSIDGKRVSVYAATRAEVETRLAKLHLQRNRPGSSMTLGEYLTTWNEREKARAEGGLRSPGTYRTRKENLETHVIPRLGHIRLAALDRTILRDWSEQGEKRLRSALNPKGKGVGTRAFQAAFAALSAALSEAVDDGLISVNPCLRQGRTSIKPAHKTSDIEILTQEEVEELISAARAEEVPRFMYYLLLLASQTGMRQGELFGLRWEDIDFKAKTVHVRRSITRSTESGLSEKDPKTYAGTRNLLVSDTVIQGLGAWKDMCPSESLVFPNDNGTWLNKNNFMSRRFRPLLEAAGIRHVTFHSIRHTYASILISKGVNVKALSVRLGHSKIQITLDTYGHLMPGDDALIVAAMGA